MRDVLMKYARGIAVLNGVRVTGRVCSIENISGFEYYFSNERKRYEAISIRNKVSMVDK